MSFSPPVVLRANAVACKIHREKYGEWIAGSIHLDTQNPASGPRQVSGLRDGKFSISVFPDESRYPAWGASNPFPTSHRHPVRAAAWNAAAQTRDRSQGTHTSPDPGSAQQYFILQCARDDGSLDVWAGEVQSKNLHPKSANSATLRQLQGEFFNKTHIWCIRINTSSDGRMIAVMRNCPPYISGLTVESEHQERLSLPDLFRQSRPSWVPGINPGMTGVLVATSFFPRLRGKCPEGAMGVFALVQRTPSVCYADTSPINGGGNSPTKKWGTISKKGAPHFPIFPVVEGFCEGQKWVKEGPVSANTAVTHRPHHRVNLHPASPHRPGHCRLDHEKISIRAHSPLATRAFCPKLPPIGALLGARCTRQRKRPGQNWGYKI